MPDAIEIEYSVLCVHGNVGRFLFEKTSGIDIGKASKIRSTLLNKLEGIAVKGFEAKVEIDGDVKPVLHRFDVMEHLLEDMPTIIRNLRRVVIARTNPDIELFEDLVIEGDYSFIDGSDNKMREIMSSEVSERLADVSFQAKIINDVHLVTLVRRSTEDIHLYLTLYADERSGFVAAEKNQEEFDYINSKRKEEEPLIIAIPSQHSPVLRCAFHREKDADGSQSSNESIIMEIETNGAITPQIALEKALGILRSEFKQS